jgi:23S rRNA-/tRNA-specific pseudouridylate synthase
VAKTPLAYDSLTAQLARRTVRRVYLAVVHGRLAAPRASSTADRRDPPIDRRMAVAAGRGRRR